VLWQALPFEDERGGGVELVHRSVDGESGYPGNLDVKVTYVLTDDGELVVDYRARSDRDTVVNLTQHSYFNLNGSLGGNILDHEIALRAHRFTPIDRQLIPTGELRDVSGTAFDFVEPRRIGSRIGDADEQLLLAGGYDHNWILDGPLGVLKVAAKVSSPLTGRVLELSTTEPGLQFYTGNALRPGVGKGAVRHGRGSGFCLEPQHFPDSPNKPHFPSTVLRKGDEYQSTTVYRFSTSAAGSDRSTLESATK
jgi:aldose 1-epimerase